MPHFRGNLSADQIVGPLTGDVTGQASRNVMTGTAEITFDGGATQPLFTVPAGKVWYVRHCEAYVRTAFDGTSPAVDIGIQGGDADGLIASGTPSTFPGTGPSFAGTEHDERGALLWDSGGGHARSLPLLAGSVIEAAVTVDGATAGAIDVLLEYAEVDAPA